MRSPCFLGLHRAPYARAQRRGGAVSPGGRAALRLARPHAAPPPRGLLRTPGARGGRGGGARGQVGVGKAVVTESARACSCNTSKKVQQVSNFG